MEIRKVFECAGCGSKWLANSKYDLINQENQSWWWDLGVDIDEYEESEFETNIIHRCPRCNTQRQVQEKIDEVNEELWNVFNDESRSGEEKSIYEDIDHYSARLGSRKNTDGNYYFGTLGIAVVLVDDGYFCVEKIK